MTDRQNRQLSYDLHSHSSCSDGVLSPQELVRRAAEKGVDILALTDHDATSGVGPATMEAAKLGLHLVPGVEISVSWGSHLIHIVGLGIDPNNAELAQGLSRLRQTRIRRAEQIGRKLAGLGFSDALAGASRLAGGDIISRSHFARFLVEQGAVKDFQAAFRRYLARGKPAYVACQWAGLDEAVQWIRSAGGQAVIAHPARYRLGRQRLLALIDDFRTAGGEGLEVVSSAHNGAEIRQMAELAGQTGLLASTGSDFHTPDAHWADLGSMPGLPAQCRPVWENWPLAMAVSAAVSRRLQ